MARSARVLPWNTSNRVEDSPAWRGKVRRRDFIRFLGSAATAWPLAARAQQAKGMLRVGVVGFVPKTSPVNALPRLLAELGYREGENLIIDYVQAAATDKSLDDAYREIAARKPDIMAALGPEAFLKAAIASSQVTPIVMMAIDYDPFAHGYVSSLARPGGRITGVFLEQIELTVKRLHIFKEAIPDINSSIVFYDEPSRDQWKAAEDAGVKLGLRLSGIDLRDPPYDYDRALADAPPDNRKNLFMPTSPLFFADIERLAKFALRNRLSSMFAFRDWVDAGGLMSYGASYESMDSSDRALHRPGRARRKARRFADRAADQIRVRHQSCNRACARVRPSAYDPGPRRRGDRIAFRWRSLRAFSAAPPSDGFIAIVVDPAIVSSFYRRSMRRSIGARDRRDRLPSFHPADDAALFDGELAVARTRRDGGHTRPAHSSGNPALRRPSRRCSRCPSVFIAAGRSPSWPARTVSTNSAICSRYAS